MDKPNLAEYVSDYMAMPHPRGYKIRSPNRIARDIAVQYLDQYGDERELEVQVRELVPQIIYYLE